MCLVPRIGDVNAKVPLRNRREERIELRTKLRVEPVAQLAVCRAGRK